MSNFEFTRKLPWREIALLRTFKIIGTFLRLLLKVWQLEEYHSHVTGEQLAFLYVHQRDIRAELLANVVEAEVQETHEIHGADAISPVHAPLALARYGFRRIIDAALLKVWLLAVLHLHDDVFAAVGLAEDVVNQRATVLELCGLLLVKERNLLDDALAFEQVVQKIQQEGAGQFLTEDALETYIGKRVDVFAHYIIAFNSANLRKKADSIPISRVKSHKKRGACRGARPSLVLC